MKNKPYDISLIRKYLNGELDGPAMYQLERRAQEDPMLMDLIAGMESGEEAEHDRALREIDDLLNQRMDRGKRRGIILWKSMSLAASVIIALSITVFFLLRKNPEQQVVKRSRPTEAPVKIPDIVPDTLKQAPPKEAQIALSTRPKPAKRTVLRPVSEPIGELIAAVPQAPDKVNSHLDEVVIVGYSSQKKSELTGAVSVLRVDTVESALVGRLAGVETRAFSKSKARKSGMPLTISGTVVDQKDKTPLPGVSVKIKGETSGVSTDVNGRFTISVPEKGESLEVLYVGYEKEVVKANRSDSLIIALKPSLAALSEVVVVGYGTDKTEITEAHPVNGWPEFRAYLRENASVEKKTDKGVVIVSFTVAPDGKLSDVGIVKGINQTIDQKAIRLLLDGPAWVGDKDGTTKVIRLRIRFH